MSPMRQPPALYRRIITSSVGIMLLLNSTVFRVQKDIHVTPTDDKIQVFETKSGSTILSKGYIDINGNASLSGSLTIKSTLRSDSTTNIGWSVQSAANQACNTTCVNACVFGEDTSVIGTFVSCTDTTADICLCAGGS